MACTSGISARLSWVLAAEVATASGRPPASVSTCSLAPGLPRSTGFGPVSGPPLSVEGPPGNRVRGLASSVGMEACRPGAAVKVERPVDERP